MENKDENSRYIPLEFLPFVIIVRICKHLSGNDLAACCATSRGMRELFGSNSIWKGKCDQRLADYLETTACKVNPSFSNPEGPDSTLSPVSKWRLAYMRLNHLWNNWRQGRYTEEDFLDTSGVFELPLSYSFLSNDYLIVQFKDRIEIINVKGSPPTKATCDIKLPNLIRNNLRIIGKDETIVVVFFTLVLVYQVNLYEKETILNHAFFIDDKQKLETQDGLEEIFLTRYRYIKDINLCHMEDDGTFVGVLHEDSRLHIWNLLTGVKLKEQDCPLANVSIINMQCSTKLMILVEDRSQVKSCLAYNISALSFASFRASFVGTSDICVVNDHVAICSVDQETKLKYLIVYNYETSEEVFRTTIQDFCKSFENTFLFINNEILKALCPLTRTSDSFPLNRVRWFKVINDRFILIRRYHSSSKLYEVKGPFRELSLTLCMHQVRGLSVNGASTRIVDGRSYLLSFW